MNAALLAASSRALITSSPIPRWRDALRLREIPAGRPHAHHADEGVAQATGLCRPATRRTEWRGVSKSKFLPQCFGSFLCFVRRGRRPMRAGRPHYPEIGRSGLGGDGKPWRIGTEVYGDCAPKKNVKRPPSPWPSPQGEGTRFFRLQITDFSMTARPIQSQVFGCGGERFSFSPACRAVAQQRRREKAGMRAGVSTIF